MKKILYTLLILSIVLTNSIRVVFADDTLYIDNTCYYTIGDDGNITIVEHYGNETEYEIPRAIGLHYVTSIKAGAFSDKVTYVKIPDTVSNIEEGAFGNKSIKIEFYNSYGEIVDSNDATIPIIVTDDKVNEENVNDKEEVIVVDPTQKDKGIEKEEHSTETIDNIEIEVGGEEKDEEIDIEIENDTSNVDTSSDPSISIETNDDTNIDTTDIDIQDDNIDEEYSVNPNSNYAFIVIGLVVIIVIGYFVYRTIKKKK